MSTVTCPDCDQRVKLAYGKSSARCPACGSRVTAGSSSAPTARRDSGSDKAKAKPKRKYREEWDDDEDDTPKKPNRRGGSLRWLWILLGVGLVLIAGCGGLVWWVVTGVKKVRDDIAGKLDAERQKTNDPFGTNPQGRPKAPPQPDASAYPKRKPFDVDPALLQGNPTVYLASLKPFDVQQGPWKLGLNGAMGSPDNRWVVVDKVNYDHAIAMHPPDHGVARVSFVVGGQVRTLSGKVALNDEWHGNDAWGAATFAVYKDGKEVWRSAPLKKRRVTIPFNVDVSGARVITLETSAPDSSHDAHCVWLDPVLQK